MEALLERAGVRDRVVFSGPLSAHEQRSAYACAELFALPSCAEKEEMTIRSRIKKEALKRRILLEKSDFTSEELEVFLERFRDKYVEMNLIRIGEEGDGGYLLPNILDETSYCFSAGIGHTVKFEHELGASYGIKSFVADASVETLYVSNDDFAFVPKFLGPRTCGAFITLSDWMEESVGRESRKQILKMDIEGGEYSVLIYEPNEVLARFSIMIIEFHKLQNLLERNFLGIFSAIFEKIFHDFSICHVHPNNCCGIAKLDGIEVPRTIEVTFIRNDLLAESSKSGNIHLPHELDRKNIENNEDIVMPEMWWKKT